MQLPSDVKRVLLSVEAIDVRVQELADQINTDYAGKDLILVGVLKGSFIFLADLARKITVPHRVDFIALSSYNNGSVSSGEVRMIMDVRSPLMGHHVLLVEDIVDTGHTLDYLFRVFAMRYPTSLKTCVLLNKPSRRVVDISATLDYVGFTIPNVFVVGYGLDFADTWRTLPYIAELKESCYS